MDAPVACVIRVWGALPPHLTDRLGGLRIAPAAEAGDDGEAVTELRGALSDQAALFGVLATLYDLGLPLLSVDCRATPEPPGEATGPPSGRR